MGKAGEKQKKKPKIKDKKQSERFKKTAREVGADKPSEGFDLVLKMMGNPEPSKPTGKPTTLLDVNSGGIVKLAEAPSRAGPSSFVGNDRLPHTETTPEIRSHGHDLFIGIEYPHGFLLPRGFRAPWG